MTGLNGNADFGFAAWSRVFLGLGLPFMFIPITAASYDGLPPAKTNQASGLINVARNVGGSIGVSLAQTLLAQRNQFHQSRLVEHIAPSDTGYQQGLQQTMRYFEAQGASSAEAAQRATAWIAQLVQAQADLLSYIDVFWTLSTIAGGSALMALLLKTVDLKAKPAGH